jgi:hypothetical protein
MQRYTYKAGLLTKRNDSNNKNIIEQFVERSAML